MKKTLTVLAASLIATGAFAATGKGYEIIKHKVTVSPGVEGYAVDVTDKKKLLSPQEIIQLQKQNQSSPEQD